MLPNYFGRNFTKTRRMLPCLIRHGFSSSESNYLDLSAEKYNQNLRCDDLVSLDSKPTSDLVRALFILKLSSVNLFVDNSEQILKFAKKIIWGPLYEGILKSTFYGQFAAGEDFATVKQNVHKLQENRIRSMLCVPIESSAACKEDFEHSERYWHGNAAIMRGCIKQTVELGEKSAFAQIKVTALCGPDLLISMNNELRDYEYNHVEPQEWSIPRIANLLKTGNFEDIEIPSFSDIKNKQLRTALQRVDGLAKDCKDKGLKLMLDAEQSYIQAALTYFVLVFQAKYNTEVPVVYNTYQCYRKDTLRRLQADLDLAINNKFKIAAKLVRGAYIEEEKRIAAEYGSVNPINESYEKTTEMYHAVFDFLLPLIQKRETGIMIASHNEDTVRYVIKKIHESNISADSKSLCFAQLYGMCDHITYGLAKMGYEVHKSVPYGSIDSTLLYLTRRAQENKSVMARSVYERRLILKELLKRSQIKLGIHIKKNLNAVTR